MIEVEFRGFLWNSSTMEVKVPPTKIEEFQRLAKDLLSQQQASANQLASLVGKIRYSAQLNPFLIAWIVEMHLHISHLVKTVGWDVVTKFPMKVKEELHHWSLRIESLPWPIQWNLDQALHTKGDAGPVGFGIEGPWETAGLWTHSQGQQSTNWRELMTWRYQIFEFVTYLENRLSIYDTDSTTAAAYVRKIYGHTPALARITADTFKFMEQHRIYQLPRVVSQDQIESSDLLSRLATKHDIQLRQTEFDRITQNWKFIPTIDLFATRFSAKTERFFSRTKDSLSLGTNAFLQSWSNEVVYAFPPERLVLRTLNKIQLENCQAMVITMDSLTDNWLTLIRTMASRSMRIDPNEVIDIYGHQSGSFPWRVWLIPSVGKVIPN
jgi:hypothetical protein